MASNRKNEERYLDNGEREMVSEARHPALSGMSADDLRALAKRLRERRDRAQNLDRRHVRAARGTEAGATEAGNRYKTALLSAAVARVNKEFSRRSEA
ncbi:MAG: hypothetical protein P0Y65_20910 [Candidatus Devosia phytovorans]|uniref:Uncharacterized protein n=1 Tax=Candidatus Devosia phytovorans TaxID=3121372 RepID=A0AAJ5VTN5_9HYPH|nr:hypothetical protein [Devosia sp.]WEK04604.1 MAG: hypothetical protein P0Y65_20910 [Devosia sp.]